MPLIKGRSRLSSPSRLSCRLHLRIKHVKLPIHDAPAHPEDHGKLWLLKNGHEQYIHMYADLFTVNRDQVMGLA